MFGKKYVKYIKIYYEKTTIDTSEQKKQINFIYEKTEFQRKK